MRAVALVLVLALPHAVVASSDSRLAGWLALYPNLGASYSQPLHLVVVDTENRIHRFAGDFGLVWDWCFTRDSRAVVYRYRFSHGVSPIGIDLRRIADGKLIRHFELAPVAPDVDEDLAIERQAPAWAACVARRRKAAP